MKGITTMQKLILTKYISMAAIVISIACIAGISFGQSSIASSEAILNPESYSMLGPVQLLGFCCIISLVILAYTIQQHGKALNTLTNEIQSRPCIWADKVKIDRK